MLPIAETSTNSVFFLVLVVGVVFLVLMKMRRPSSPGPKLTPRRNSTTAAASATAKAVGEGSAEVRRWEVNMHELARDLSAQLDSKMVALQQLMRMADERIAQLESLQNAAKTFGSQAGLPTTALRSDTLASAAHGDRPLGLATGDHQAIALREAMAASPTHAESRPFDNIYALADRGAAPAAIAEQTDTPLGEVELILGLRRRRAVD